MPLIRPDVHMPENRPEPTSAARTEYLIGELEALPEEEMAEIIERLNLDEVESVLRRLMRSNHPPPRGSSRDQ